MGFIGKETAVRSVLNTWLNKSWYGASRQTMLPLYRQALRIAWPAALEGLLISVITSADTMMVGSISPAAIAAVGLTAQPRMILLVLAQSLSIGTTALVARRKGAGDEKGIRACLEQSLFISLLLGALITLIGFFLAEPLMRFSGANEDTFDLSVNYFHIISLGFIFNSIQLCVTAAFRGLGQTRITLVTHMVSNVLNLTFNFLLINGHLGFPRLGVNGAAIATLIGTVCAGLISIWFVMREGSPLRYRPRVPRFDQTTLKALLNVGSSALAESGFLRLGFVLTNRVIASLGTVTFAAFQVVSQVSSLSFTLCDGVATAGVAMVGQSLGAEDELRAKRSVSAARHISVAVSILLMVAMFLLRRDMAALFTQDEAVIQAATAGFLVVIPGLLPQNGRVVYAGCLRGAGDVKYVALIALIGVGILRPALTWLFCFPLDPVFPALFLTATGPWFSFLIDAVVRNFLLARRIRSGVWTRMRLS